MIVLLDTNVIMDALQERSPFDISAKEILMQGQDGKFTCLFTANAAADIFYLYSKARDMKNATTALAFLLKTYTVVSVTHEDCNAAISLGIEDFEDSLVAVCAKKANADYIITRDEKFLTEDSPVRTISPSEFLECDVLL
ncbi:MAG: PIN domain-containing protein [Oscillospiraceae bacterium]|nr:PIN domain-containing protein [Oscillospiraceae bacterium]